uniref:Uncharacterized protein n=1 Tax=Rhizophora mucronata TaxID=61149 RepID=A0A2P2PTG6_RHIMU
MLSFCGESIKFIMNYPSNKSSLLHVISSSLVDSRNSMKEHCRF